MKAPGFWHRGGVLPTVLTPASWLYRTAASLKSSFISPYQAPVPVLCVGNLIAGGAGKTPVALALGRALVRRGLKVAFLSRGYGGRETGPMAAEAGADIILLDDGFQNPALAKTMSVLVVDGGYGFGNGHVIPAGPLREPVSQGLARADAVMLLGDDPGNLEGALNERLPVFRGHLTPTRASAGLRGERAIAFAGIGRPGKFFDTLRTLGVELIATRSFGDHEPYRGEDLIDLIAQAEQEDALLLTTSKDHVRLPEELRLLIRRVDVELAWEDPAGIETLLDRIAAPETGVSS